MAAPVASFQFATAGRVVFGRGCAVAQVAAACAQCAPEGGVFVVRGGGAAPRPSVAAVLAAVRDRVCGEFVLPAGEPTVETAERATQQARAAGARAVLAVGGGSVLDAGKAVAALAANGGAVLDYLEVVGRGAPLRVAALPVVAVPTTAGTGSEVTKNAVLASAAHGVKASLRAESMLPRVALVDAALTDTCPAAVTVASGLDALTQCIEPLVSAARNPLTDALCLAGIAHAFPALARIAESLSASADTDSFACSAENRDRLCFASLCGGLALANAKLGIVHGIAGPAGGMLAGAAHGALCGALLPHAMRANVAAVRALDAADPRRADLLARYGRIAGVVTGRDCADADEGVAAVARLVRELRAPSLGALGLDRARVDELAAKALRAGSTKGNALPLTQEQIASIIVDAL